MADRAENIVSFTFTDTGIKVSQGEVEGATHVVTNRSDGPEQFMEVLDHKFREALQGSSGVPRGNPEFLNLSVEQKADALASVCHEERYAMRAVIG